MNASVLITGGFGYVGGRIARALAAANVRVRVHTRRPPERWPAWSSEVEVVRADLGDDAARAGLCRGMSAVVHCAAMNEIDCARDAVGALMANGVDSLRLLESAVGAGVGRFVYLSTAFVYGSPLSGILHEGVVARPQAAYGITHRTAEDFVLAAHDRGALDGVVVRLSNAVGAPADPLIDRWTLVANDLCRQAVADRRLVLKSSGLARRDFIPLSAVSAAVGHLLSIPRDRLGDGLFNLGSGVTRTLVELAELVAARAALVLGAAPPISRGAVQPGESHPDLDYRVGKLRAAGFSPSDDLAAEIDATLRLCAAASAPKLP